MCNRSVAEARTIYVGEGQEFTTIQPAIDAAVNGDTVIVKDGTYKGAGNKNLDFKGKAITLQSENGAANTIIDCKQNGRGFYFHSKETASSVVDGLTIRNGKADNGGGISCSPPSSPSITNCTISDNSAGSYGGGISCSGSSPSITNCTISGNSSGNGGGISCLGSSPSITNCTISGNSASDGGGISCSGSSPSITNCTISGNSADRYGGGISCLGSSSSITNCTISGNSASSGWGGGISCESSSSRITNCILWNDSRSEVYAYIIDEEESHIRPPTFTYSNIQGGYPGTGNINADPLFTDPNTGDYHLQLGSPCIDAGTSNGAPSFDKDGNPRPNCSGYDMGAYEVQSCVCTIYYKDADGDAYGITNDTKCLGSPEAPYTAIMGDDCNDADAQINPGATEVCDGKDNNCDGLTDPAGSTKCITLYKDADNDYFGVTNDTRCLCSPEAPYAAIMSDDCNDGNAQVNPDATEKCNSVNAIDDNCDGRIDEGFDADGDGFETCTGTGGGDCNDTDPAIYPGAAEVCDGQDNNCDGATDEGFNLQTDPQNCRVCGYVCSYPHAAALCASGTCQMGSCDAGWQDKDGDPANGCESEEGCSTWKSMIKATGQEEGSTVRVSNVTIGASSNPHTAPSPGMPPECTVYMRIKDKTLNQYNSVDIRSCSSESEYWILGVQIGDAADPGQPGYYPLLSWNPDQFSFDPEKYYSLYLGNRGREGTLLVADMRDVTSYQIKQGDGEYFSIVWSKELWEELCVDLNLTPGWNLVSLPILPGNLPGNATAGALFPDAVAIYEFDPSSGYLLAGPGNTMRVGEGYWVNVPAAKSYPICGQKVSSHSQQITQGWSLIGGISCISNVQALSGNIEALYSFDPSYGYVLNPTHHLVPGLGYWINLSQSSMITLTCLNQASPGYTSIASDTAPIAFDAVPLSSDTIPLAFDTVPQLMPMINTAAQSPAWKASLMVTGQEAGSAVRVSNVGMIGIADVPARLPAPAAPPEYTVRALLKDPSMDSMDSMDKYYGEDVRGFSSLGSISSISSLGSISSKSQRWVIRVEINNGFADTTASGYYPVIEWNMLIPGDPASGESGWGKFELHRGDSGNGDLLVADMKSTHSYQTTAQDVVKIDDDFTVQYFSIVWSACDAREICGDGKR